MDIESRIIPLIKHDLNEDEITLFYYIVEDFNLLEKEKNYLKNKISEREKRIYDMVEELDSLRNPKKILSVENGHTIKYTPSYPLFDQKDTKEKLKKLELRMKQIEKKLKNYDK